MYVFVAYFNAKKCVFYRVKLYDVELNESGPLLIPNVLKSIDSIQSRRNPLY